MASTVSKVTLASSALSVEIEMLKSKPPLRAVSMSSELSFIVNATESSVGDIISTTAVLLMQALEPWAANCKLKSS